MSNPNRLPFALWESPADRDQDLGRITQPWLDAIERCGDDLPEVLMVLDLVMGDGTRFRVATSLLESVAGDGTNRAVAPALMSEPSVDDDYDPGNASSGARSVEVAIPQWFIKPLTRIQSGLPLAGFGELSLLEDGMGWNDRRVIVRGDVSGGVSFGGARNGGQLPWSAAPACAQAEVLELSVQDPRESADVLFPPAVADTVAWPSMPNSGVGRPYPVVFGEFIYESIRVDDSAVSPRFVVGYGHDLIVLAAWYQAEDVIPTGDYTVLNGSDDRGVPVTVLSYTGAAITWRESDRVTVSVRSPDGTDPDLLTTIRDVLLRFHPAGSLLVSDSLFAEAMGKLKVSIRGVANRQTSLLEWVEGGILDDFPMVSMVWDGGRYGPVVTDWRGTPRMELVLGTELLRWRASGVTETPKFEMLNAFTMRYAYDGLVDEYGGILQQEPDARPSSQASRAAVGRRQDPEVQEALFINDVNVAQLVLDWMSDHLSLATYFAEFVGAASLYLRLRRGDLITLTAPELSWYGVRATVERIGYQRGQTTLGLRMWTNPFRDGPYPPPP